MDRCTLAYGPNGEGLCEWCGLPRPETEPRWCSGSCADAHESAHRWPLARRAALARAARRCQVCGTREKVQVHHREPVQSYAPGCGHHPDNLAVLCTKDHARAHVGLRSKPGTQLRLAIAA